MTTEIRVKTIRTDSDTLAKLRKLAPGGNVSRFLRELVKKEKEKEERLTAVIEEIKLLHESLVNEELPQVLQYIKDTNTEQWAVCQEGLLLQAAEEFDRRWEACMKELPEDISKLTEERKNELREKLLSQLKFKYAGYNMSPDFVPMDKKSKRLLDEGQGSFIEAVRNRIAQEKRVKRLNTLERKRTSKKESRDSA